MIIREEHSIDFDNIYLLIKTAFQTAPFSDGDEQDYAVRLRNSKEYVPEFALVAVEDEKLIGHIMLTKTYMAMQENLVQCLLLSPLCVAQEHRKKGIGASLITEAVKRAKKTGHKAIFLCGDQAYYGRFGFRSVANYQISYKMSILPEHVLVLELEKGWLKDIKGEVNFL